MPRPQNFKSLAPILKNQFLLQNVITGNANNVRDLLLAGANPNIQCELRDTALIWAISKNNLTIVSLLLKSLADPNKPGQNDETPLTWAARLGNEEILKLLIEYGAIVTDWPVWEKQMRHSEYSIDDPKLKEDNIQKSKLFIQKMLAAKTQTPAQQYVAEILDDIFPDELLLLSPSTKAFMISNFSETALAKTQKKAQTSEDEYYRAALLAQVDEMFPKKLKKSETALSKTQKSEPELVLLSKSNKATKNSEERKVSHPVPTPRVNPRYIVKPSKR